jgi:peptidoglycan-associated lipoprotein
MRRLFALLVLLAASSCTRSSDDVWNDTQSAGRHMSRGVKTLCGFHGESRQINSNDEFDSSDNVPVLPKSDFIGFEDASQMRIGDEEILQAQETPGEEGSSIPGIDSFSDPALDPALAELFKHVHFEYNSSLIKGDENITIITAIADWMKNRPAVYLFIEGHCDSRGPSAYNFALGANRSNAVRNLLIQEGVDHDHIFTISYGKERPLVDGEGEEIWKQNRRAQFKIYER